MVLDQVGSRRYYSRRERRLHTLIFAGSCLVGGNTFASAFTTTTKWTHPQLLRATNSRNGVVMLRMSAEKVVSKVGNLAVAIDQPLIFDNLSPVTTHAPRPKLKLPEINIDWLMIKKSLLGFFASDKFRTAAVVFGLFFVLSFLARSIKKSSSENLSSDDNIRDDDSRGNLFGGAAKSMRTNLTALKLAFSGGLLRVRERFRKQVEEVGTPMPFDYGNDNEGWGVCTLRSKRRLGRSSFVQYEFDLPEADYILPLDLGQQVSVCCLDNHSNVAKGEFFPYSPDYRPRLGTFSILAPNRTPTENEFAIGDDAANFVRVLKQDLKVGDEVALKPGKNRLEYRGQYLPVTDMVYIACGTGIVPVMDQVRMVLPSFASSSVESVTAVWINESTRDFDVTAEQLEKEYNKYSSKLAVSCIVDDLTKGQNALSENSEIYEAVPDFIPGTMAVLSGPVPIMKQAVEYLEGRGYPLDCLCIL